MSIHALDLHGGGVPELDRATYVNVQVGEELPPPGHVVRGAGVEVPAIDPVVVGAVAEEIGRASCRERVCELV